jgi:predicted nucleotidyltransferase
MEVKKTEDFFDVSALIDERFGQERQAGRKPKRKPTLSLSLFGTDCLEPNQRNKSSYARGEQKRRSDVDILVRFDREATITLIDYARIMNNLEDYLHKKVDLVQEGCLYKFAQQSAEHDKILVYERAN